MALEERTSLYELLVRWGPNGFVGAHAIDLEEVLKDGQVHSARELPARPITQAEFGKLLGGQSARLIEAADAARSAQDAETRQRLAAEAGRDDALRAAQAAAETHENEKAAFFATLKDRDERIESLGKARDEAERKLSEALAKLENAGKP